MERQAEPEPAPNFATLKLERRAAPQKAAASKAPARKPDAAKPALSLRGDKEETVPVGEGMPLTLEVDPRRGAAAVSCAAQWHKDGQPLDGATETKLTIESVTAADAGVYSCVVESEGETVRSKDKTVELVESQPLCLTELAPGESWLIAGEQKTPLSFGVDVTGGLPGETPQFSGLHDGESLVFGDQWRAQYAHAPKSGGSLDIAFSGVVTAATTRGLTCWLVEESRYRLLTRRMLRASPQLLRASQISIRRRCGMLGRL